MSILILFTLFFSACSYKTVEVENTILFPAYPDEPRILYLKTFRGGIVKEADSSFTNTLDSLLGEKTSKPVTSNIVKPYGTAVQNGKVYVADTGSSSVFVIDEDTRKTNFIGTGVIGRVSAPIGIAFDSNNTTYISDRRLKTIQGYDENLSLVFSIGGRLEFTTPSGIAIDKNLNRLYVIDTKAHHFKAFDINTKELLFTIGIRGRKDGEFNFPTNISIDRRNSNIVVCDTQNFRIQVFDKDGNFIRKFGKVGDRPGMFARPKGVAVDSDGNIYVTDSAFNNIQIFNDEGELMMWFGSAGYGPTQFRLITGIYIDETDKIAIADGFSGRVQTFQYLSETWKENNSDKYKELKEFKAEVKQAKKD